MEARIIMKELSQLATPGSKPIRSLQVFETPQGVNLVKFETNEFTSLCPKTGQPDFQKVIIEYAPLRRCLESKSLKTYLWTFRQEGAFCEDLASIIAKDVFNKVKPKWVTVTIEQNPRGGIALTARATEAKKK